MSVRILEVHKPIGFQAGNWPTCAACSDPYPCSDVLRIIEDPS